MNDRGEYRTLYVAFADDPDVHALSGDAVKLFLMLKLSLPAIGIGVIYPSKLCDQVGCDRARLEVILRELESPKSGKHMGWIRRERNVVWIVNGLACEPGLSAANVKKHVPFVKKVLNSLDNRSQIVNDFKTYYPQWFQPLPIEHPKASDSLPLPKQVFNKSLTKQVHSNTSGSEPVAGKHFPAADTASAPLASLTDALKQLPKGALDFLSTFYGREIAGTDRRTDVARQLLATLADGAEYRGQRVLAYSRDRLVAKCRAVIREGVRDPDKAIAVLLLKLGDTSDGTAPGAEAGVATAAEIVADERDAVRDIASASTWLEDHPEIEAAIDEQLATELPPIDEQPMQQLTRTMMRRSLIITAWRAAGAETAEAHA